MKEIEQIHYIDSVLYVLEQTTIYTRVKGAQLFNELKLGITADQFIALDAVYCNKDICQRDLSKIILKDRSNTGRILNILEENGFITRSIETKGKRLVKKIYITEKGKKIIENSHPKIRTAFAEVFDEISEEEFHSLRAILEKVRHSLSKITSIQI